MKKITLGFKELNKKVVSGLVSCLVGGLLSGVLVNNAMAEDIVVDITHVNYYYASSTKKCIKTPFKQKNNLLNDYRNGFILVNKQYKNDAGVYTWFIGEDKDGEFSIDTFNSYGECKAFEKLIILKGEITDWEYYKNLRDPNENKSGK